MFVFLLIHLLIPLFLVSAIGQYLHDSKPPGASLTDGKYLILSASFFVPNFKVVGPNGSVSHISFPYGFVGPGRGGNVEFLSHAELRDFHQLEGCHVDAKITHLSWLFVDRDEVWGISCKEHGFEISAERVEEFYNRIAMIGLLIQLVGVLGLVYVASRFWVHKKI